MISSTSESKLYISPTPLSSFSMTQQEYEAISDWVEVKEVENLGEHGDESAAVTFTAIRDGRVRKLKGSRNAGTMAVVCGRDPSDAGQQAMKTAEKTKFNHAFKIVAADAPTEEYTDSIFYLPALVMSARNQFNENDSVTRIAFNLEIQDAPVEVGSELISS